VTWDVCAPTGEVGSIPRAGQWHQSPASFPAFSTEHASTNGHAVATSTQVHTTQAHTTFPVILVQQLAHKRRHTAMIPFSLDS